MIKTYAFKANLCLHLLNLTYSLTKENTLRKKLLSTDQLQLKDILSDISITLPPNSISGLTGKSGSGKSSLFRCFNRLDTSYQGKILLEEKNTQDIPTQQLREKILYLFQEPLLFCNTVIDELYWPFQLNSETRKDLPDKHQLTEHLKSLDLNVNLHSSTKNLSGGEKQRLCLLKAFLSSPTLLLLDEPSSALNPELALHSIKYLLQKFPTTVFMITHQHELLDLCDQHFTLQNKTLTLEGS